MNLNQLYYFNELVKQKQFSKAAKNLYISQPSLSNSIKSLENDLGCKLINRSNGQISLTEYGEIFFNAASSSINLIENAKLEIAQYKRKNANTIKIASIPSALSDYLPSAIQKFKNEVPTNTTFEYQNYCSNKIYSELESGNFDIGICSKANNSSLTFLPLYSREIVALVRPDHPLAKFKNEIEPQQLQGFELVTYSQKTVLGKKLSKILSTKKLNVSNLNLDNELSIAVHVLSNDNVGICMNSKFLDNFDLKRIKIKVPKDINTVYLAYNSKKELSNISKKLINSLTKND